MSRTNFGAKPLMYPQPVLIIGTYDEKGVPNAMNAAWGIETFITHKKRLIRISSQPFLPQTTQIY